MINKRSIKLKNIFAYHIKKNLNDLHDNNFKTSQVFFIVANSQTRDFTSLKKSSHASLVR